MTDLAPENRQHLIDWVMRTEQALRQTMNPDKINLASLGNMVPHLHWHVIPRFSDDPHFPAPIWATAKRPVSRQPQPDLAKSLTAVLLKTL
jgi:diadenosine tetraphosphate (Ap4A) HIT family hydrolase